MSKAATNKDRRKLEALPYAPEGCPINVGKQKCGETVGLDIIMDFHKLYQEKMSEIDVSAGGDSLQEKVNLQEQWIEDLTAQNKLLARVIEELESETIGRVQKLEDKLNNAVKSFGEDGSRAMEEKEKKIEKLKDDLKALPAAEKDLKKLDEESERLKQVESEKEIKSHHIPETHSEEEKPQNEKPLNAPEKLVEIVEPVDQPDASLSKTPSTISMNSGSQGKLSVDASSTGKQRTISKASFKSVHLIVDDGKDGSQVVEPVKDLTVSPEYPEKPSIDGVPVVGTHDSLELQRKSMQSFEKEVPEAGADNVCVCETKEYWQRLDELTEENKMLREGNELQRLKDEVEEKMRRILELNEENRTLNDMINMLRTNQITEKKKEPPTDSEPMSSDSECYPGSSQASRAPGKPSSPKKTITCRQKCAYPYRNTPDPTQMSRKPCICEEDFEKGSESPPFIDVYTRKDKGKFNSGSSSSVCNEEICPFLKYRIIPYDNQERARGGKDSDNHGTIPSQSNGLMDKCQDTTCSNKDNSRIVQTMNVDAIDCSTKDFAVSCGNSICQTEMCEDFPENVGPLNSECTREDCLNPTCEDRHPPIGVVDIGVECRDESCPKKDYYPPFSTLSAGANFPIPTDQQYPSQGFVKQGPQYDPQALTTGSAHGPTIELGVMDEKSSKAVNGNFSTGFSEMPSALDGNIPAAVETENTSHVIVHEPSEVSFQNDPAAIQGTYVQIKEISSEEVYYEPLIDTDEKISALPNEQASDSKVTEMPYAEEKEAAANQGSTVQFNETPSEEVCDKPPIHEDERSAVLDEVSPGYNTAGSGAVSEELSNVISKKPSATTPVDNAVSPTVIENPTDQIIGNPSAVVNDTPSVHMTDKPSIVAAEKPLEDIGESIGESIGVTTDDTTRDKKITSGVSTEAGAMHEIPPVSANDRTITRCICKSKFCNLVPDPESPGQRLCVDSSNANIDIKNGSCVCQSPCPNIELMDSNYPDEVCPPCEDPPIGIPNTKQGSPYSKGTTVLTVHQLYQMPKTPESLSKEQEYAGLSRKDNTTKRSEFIAPRGASSQYEIEDDELTGYDDNKDSDLKLVIADLKSKLLDAEDKIEELKIGNNYIDKDNDTTLIIKYSEEIKQMKKSLKWTKKEREEYEFLKQRVKLLEQGKSDTDNITSNLQTADEKIVIKNQLKKLTKKNKCYEEVVQFFKEEMSVMSNELLTLQEVLNVTNVSSQDENNKLIGAILQLRRINDRLVEHLCAIEKQALLESQINQINETRINELQEIISSKNNDLAQHDTVIQGMRIKLNNATRQNADLKSTIKNLTDTVVEIQEGIKSVERDQMKNLNDVSVVQSKVCLANGDLESIKTCMEQKNSRIVDLEGQLKSQEVELILATKELGMLKEKKTNSKGVINSLKEQLSIAEKKNQEIIGDYQLVVKKLQGYSSLQHMKNYELNHYKSLVEEMKTSLIQLNNGLDKCEASNIHFYEDLKDSDHPRGSLQHRKDNLPIVFEELKKSMAELNKRISDGDVKSGLIEEELLKVKESHMSQISEEVTDTQKELQEKITSSIEEQSRVNQLLEDQKEEIRRLHGELEKDVCCCKRSVSELKNEKTNSNAQMEISQLKCELNKSIHRQKLLNEENDQIHNQMINLRKKLTTLEQAYDVLRQESEDYKQQLKRTTREKEYLAHKYQYLKKTMEEMKSTNDQLEKQCRTMMERMSEQRSWIKTPMQQPFSQRRYGTMANLDRQTAPPTRTRRLESHTADARNIPSSPLVHLSPYTTDAYLSEDTTSQRSNMVRNISYDSNSSPYTSRSPSPRSNSIHGEDDLDEMNLNDWFSPNFKESNTDAEEGEEDAFINKVHIMTAQVQEVNKRWQKKMNKKHLSKSRASNK